MNFNKHSSKDVEVPHQNRRFLEACEVMRKNAEKFLDNASLSLSSSEDEIDTDIMEKTFLNYTEDDDSNLRKIREYLQDILTSGAIVCLICIESVKRSDKVWSCVNCYCILHLHCIRKWAKDSLYHLSTYLNEEKKDSLKWCCPKCRSEYETSEQPVKYFCFCGKVENPSLDTWNIPHACGKSCNKRLNPECGHTCSLLCHPGPCPPCPQTVFVTCCCSKSKVSSRRCSSKEWTCGAQCGKLLSCNIHYCKESCHIGTCPACTRQSKQHCLCGLSVDLRPCYDPKWQCSKICSKKLSCGKHFCETLCHEGFCKDCPNSGPRSCPCGKVSVVLPCTEDIVPCGDTCNKLLHCGLHKCSQRCHHGECEKCIQMRVKKCRCGQKEKSVLCCTEFVCDIKCKMRRDCGRHNCNRKCCKGNCPPCEAVCGRTLNCGQHKCISLCHPGPCYPCKDVVDVTCNCGSTKISVPCGRKKSAVPPRCIFDCRLPSECHHKQRHKHKCHFGPCPPCRLLCEKKLICGHSCSHRCHSAVLSKIETKQKKEGPWDLKNACRFEVICKPCPPCNAPIPVTCLGGHETQILPCFSAQSTSCGRKCGRVLQCSNHFCSWDCHAVNDISDLSKDSNNCESCNEICQKERNADCPHSCPRPCHPGCCEPCKLHIKVKCHCQINTMYIICKDWTSANEDEKIELKNCSNRCPKEMVCGHRCILTCHPGPCAIQENCKKKIILRCPCKRKKKEVQCNILLNQYSPIMCDNECLEYQKSLQDFECEKVLKKKAEEKKMQEKELEEFLRKTEGKKKKKKKQIENTEKYNNHTVVVCFIAILMCLIAIIIFYVM